MKKRLITTVSAFVCAMLCAFSLTACGDKKDENDIIAAEDWTTAFSAVANPARYYQQCKAKCDPENDFITQSETDIGYNSDEKQYFKSWKSSSGDFISRYVWEKSGKHYCRQNNEEVFELADHKWDTYTDFDVLEKPFLLSFCKDKFSDFKYYGVSLDENQTVEYKATNIEIAIPRDENTFALGGRGNIYVTFSKEKQIIEIQAFVNTADNERWGFHITDIGTWDSSVFDDFSLPEAP